MWSLGHNSSQARCRLLARNGHAGSASRCAPKRTSVDRSEFRQSKFQNQTFKDLSFAPRFQGTKNSTCFRHSDWAWPGGLTPLLTGSVCRDKVELVIADLKSQKLAEPPAFRRAPVFSGEVNLAARVSPSTEFLSFLLPAGIRHAPFFWEGGQVTRPFGTVNEFLQIRFRSARHLRGGRAKVAEIAQGSMAFSKNFSANPPPAPGSGVFAWPRPGSRRAPPT